MRKAQFSEPAPKTLDAIKRVLGPAGWKAPQDASRYFEDPRGRFRGQASLIALPASTTQVAEIVRLCAANSIGIVPYSGGTGVVAGQLSIDSDNAIVVSLERMNKLRHLSVDDSVIVVEAGFILENVHAAAQDHDMMFPLNMASKGSCCIGGNLATNAGGIQVLRYGNARDLCLGVEAVLPDGTVLDELSPLHKNNTGYDLRHLLIGSEGTLGIITAATLKLKPQDPETSTACLAIGSPANGLAVFQEMKRHLGDSISAVELMRGLGLTLVASKFPDLRPPFAQTPDWAILLEASGALGLGDRMHAALGACFDKDLLTDAVVAQSQSQRDSLWALRENTPAANRMAGAFCNSDTSVPLSHIDDFVKDTLQAIFDIHPDVQINSYGHLGDGNIHHNVLPPTGVSKTEFVSANPGIIDAVRLAINDVTQKHNGSISAEHGIGRLKTNDLETYASAARYDTLKRIKAALDPKSIMNPGALIR
ncbi:FAD-binding oxidoreductase [Ascidiaceihabitans sp.]|uniref:FAD-binding oxidoreductase n=1 Tax=Ascidiaceihabitans sp. TaxID=1872644 RepID=UPI003299302F